MINYYRTARTVAAIRLILTTPTGLDDAAWRASVRARVMERKFDKVERDLGLTS